MNKSPLNINFGSRVFVLPYDTVRAKLEEASSNHLKVLMLMAMDESARMGYPGNADALASSVGLSKKAFESALAYWCEAGVFTAASDVPPATAAASVSAAPQKQNNAPHTAPSPESAPKVVPDASRPQYTGLELEKLIAGRKELKQLIDACQGVLKKVFSPAENSKLVELSDYLRLDDDYILLLCCYCTDIGKGSIPYIYKTAYQMHDDGIVTAAALDEYIKGRERLKEGTTKLRTLIGIGDRTLTPKEKECFDTWLSKWNMPFELLEHAYAITINNTENHKMSLPYMNKVLQNWYNSGYKTVEEADNALAEYRRVHDNGTTESSFDTAEFFEAALRRSYSYAKQDNNAEPPQNQNSVKGQ